MILGKILDAKMGGVEMQKQAFRNILDTKKEVSVFRESASKMEGQIGPKMSPKSMKNILYTTFWFFSYNSMQFLFLAYQIWHAEAG